MQAEVRRRRVPVTGTTLACEEWGWGRPLVCLHGGMGVDSAYLRAPGVLGLAGERRRVVVYDQRGHGASGPAHPADFTHARWAEDVRELAAAVAPGPFALLGHSYGGFIALEFAARHARLLTALVLVGTSPGPVVVTPPPLESDEALRQMFRRQWPQFFPGPDKHWDVFEQMTFSREPFLAAFGRELPRYDVRERVANLAVPTLLVVGSDDPYRANMEGLAGVLSRSRLVVLPGTGHLPFWEQPETFRAAVDGFLRDTDA